MTTLAEARVESVNNESIEFPLTLQPSAHALSYDELKQWVSDNRDQLCQQIRKHGALLFRGWPVESPEQFNDLCEALGMQPLPYVGGAAPRNNVYKGVFTSNESPPSEPIPFHHGNFICYSK
jgi:hypothetical protein